MQDSKTCSVCKIEKPISEFYGRRGDCKLCNNIKSSKYHREHPEKCKNSWKSWRHSNPEKVKARNREFRETHPNYFKEYDKASIEITKRYQVLSYYSNGIPSCKWCGNQNFVVLNLDHINNDGGEHRRKDKSADKNLAGWLRRHEYPSGFQVLCCNCNWAKRMNFVMVNGMYIKRDAIAGVFPQ